MAPSFRVQVDKCRHPLAGISASEEGAGQGNDEPAKSFGPLEARLALQSSHDIRRGQLCRKQPMRLHLKYPHLWIRLEQ
jgi:hypothetical protein